MVAARFPPILLKKATTELRQIHYYQGDTLGSAPSCPTLSAEFLRSMATFGSLLRGFRLRAGLGLRTFAGLIDQRASTVSAIESHRRAPWRQQERLRRVADVLGIVESSATWQEICALARQETRANETNPPVPSDRMLSWWWLTEGASRLESDAVAELASFVGVSPHSATASAGRFRSLPALTELSIEWRVRRLLGRRNLLVAAGPVDVETILENQANVRLEIVPGLVPRFSVQACVVRSGDALTIYVDRIVGDSRPLAFYRRVLAECYAPIALWDENPQDLSADWFMPLQASQEWPHLLRDCERFALAMLLPANPVLAGAEMAFCELVEQQGWVDPSVASRAVRNRVAEQFAVPPALLQKRLAGWPCYLQERIARALAAQEITLPPIDWIAEENLLRQQTLFDLRPQ